MTRLRLTLAALALLVVLAADAEAAPRLRVTSAPVSATPGQQVTLKLAGPRTGAVRVYVLTHSKLRKSDRPVVRGKLKRGKATLKLRAPAKAGTYQLIACRGTRCTAARRLRVAAPAVERVSSLLPAPSPTPTPSPSPADVVSPRPAASPLKVTLRPGTTKSSATIGADGGSVVATAGGFDFTLTIPKSALAAPEEITLAPLADVSGLGLTPVAGVLMEPDGLAFMKAVDLAVKGSGTPDPATLVGYGTDGEGGEAHLTPIKVAGGAVHLALWHFSAAGTASGTAAEVDAFIKHVPTSDDDLAQQSIAVAREKFAAGDLSEAGFDAAVVEALTRWRLASVEPKLQSAETDGGLLESATSDFLAWQAVLAGSGLDMHSHLERLIGSHKHAVTFAYDEAFRRCVEQKEFERMGRMLALQALDQALGYGLSLDDEMLVRCGRFKLDIDQRYDYKAAPWVFGDLSYSETRRAYRDSVTGVRLVYELGTSDFRATTTHKLSDWVYSFTLTDPNDPPGCTPRRVSADPIAAPATAPVVVTVTIPVNFSRRTIITTLPPTRVSAVGAHIPLLWTASFGSLPKCGDSIRGEWDEQPAIPTVTVPYGATSGSVKDDKTVSTDPLATRNVDTTVTLTHMPCASSIPLANCP